MRTIAIALVIGLALLASGCGKQPQDQTSGSASTDQWNRPGRPPVNTGVGINNPNVEKGAKCVAAIPSNESAQQQVKDEGACDKKYPVN